jgi:hypothetical protein
MLDHLGDHADPSPDCAGLSKDPFLRPVNQNWTSRAWVATGLQTSSLAASAQFLDAVSDLGRSLETSLRHEEAKLLPCGSVDKQDGSMIGRVTFLYYVGWDGFPLAVFQVLPLV